MGGAGALLPAPKMAAVAMRLPVIRKAVGPSGRRSGEKHLVVPGDTITTDTGYMRWGRRQRGCGEGTRQAALGLSLHVRSVCRGHGTYVDEEKLVASVAGAVERVNKLVCVTPLKTR